MQVLRIGVTGFRKANSVDWLAGYMTIVCSQSSTSQCNLCVSSSSIYQKYYIYPLKKFNSVNTTLHTVNPRQDWRHVGVRNSKLISTVSQQEVQRALGEKRPNFLMRCHVPHIHSLIWILKHCCSNRVIKRTFSSELQCYSMGKNKWLPYIFTVLSQT